MTILGIVALIVVIVLGVLVLRVKSDPLENESLRKDLDDFKRNTSPAAESAPERQKQ